MRIVVTFLLLVAASAVAAGCGPATDAAQQPTSEALDDGQTKAQVVDPAIVIAKGVPLPDAVGGYSVASCRPDGQAPFRGDLLMFFGVPQGPAGDAALVRVADSMIASGWTPKSGNDDAADVRVLIKSGVTAVIGLRGSKFPGRARIQLEGQCRNPGPHDAQDLRKVDVTEVLR